jgi:predicted methyltransferase
MNKTGRLLTLASALVAFTSTTGYAHENEPHAQAEMAQATVNAELSNAVKSQFRTEANTLRDKYRHPAETLAFFNLKSTDTVIELWPGAGWYTEIIAPYVADKGQYVAAGFETAPKLDTPGTQYFAKAGKAYQAWLAERKEHLGKVSSVTLDPPGSVSLGDPASADVVLTFRNLHNWAMKEQLEGVLSAAFNVLKSGGTFGVVEHRANKGMKAESGYMEQGAMIALAEKAGFKLVASSEINANPKDTKDHPKGVWTLPPRLALDGVDKDKYLEIGESDRMTLKFIKPMAK